MKHRLMTVVAVVLFFISVSAGAQVNYLEPEFGWISPSVMAQGGSAVAARGFDLLFYNPAGYAEGKGQFHIVISAEGIANPFILLEDFHNGLPIVDAAINQLVANGVGAHARMGLGWVGGGFGAALLFNSGTLLDQTDNTLATSGSAYADIGLTGGYARLFNLPGEMVLGVGGTARIFYRMRSPVSFSDVSPLLTGDELDFSVMSVLGGLGLGLDLGGSLRWKDLYAQVTLKNLGHGWMLYQEGNLEDFFELKPPTGSTGDDRYIIPMTIMAGVEYHPDLGHTARLVDPRVSFSYDVPLLIGIDPLTYQGYVNKTFFHGIHLGGEVRLLNLFLFRAGLNQGYITAGAGIDFRFGELSVALYSREKGRISGDTQEMAGSFQLSFRF